MKPGRAISRSAGRIVLLALLAWGTLQGLSIWLHWSPRWPLWWVALGMAAAAEAIWVLGKTERERVPRQTRRWILGLRLASLVLVGWILLEPAWVRTVSRERQRVVAVVLDESASMSLRDEGAAATRLELGRAALDRSGLVAGLSGRLRVRTFRMARTLRGEEPATSGWDQATDLAAGLQGVLDRIPPDELAGAIVVSDGRHNQPASVAEAARRFGALDAPVGVVAVGDETPPRDAAVTEVTAPEAIHLGERMQVLAKVKIDGYRGQRARVRVVLGGEVLEERVIPVGSDHHREELRFSFTPKDGGVRRGRVEIEPLPGERFAQNNEWDFETSITDARTNVLLVDGHPRWEFRYLRNLFYGRDKSVHLQWVLTNPDNISGLRLGGVAASAARPFGEAQAEALPVNEAEWRKFDVIILGDIGPRVLDDATWKILERCVNERGALLLFAAGPRHRLNLGQAAERLLPVEPEPTPQSGENRPFSLAVAPEGRLHPIVQQATGGADNSAVWAAFPDFGWRLPARTVKKGGEVLLLARGEEADENDLAAGMERLVRQRESEAREAVLVTRQSGRGKVAALLTDHTWRLREGSGDVYHHRFWGNLIRWGAGPTLRAGNERARLGTDQLSYSPDGQVRLTARLRGADMSPVFEERLRVKILRDGQVLATVPMLPQRDSNGLHEGVAGPFPQTGRYEALLEDPLTGTEVQAGFRVSGTHGPAEWADVTLDRSLLEEVARLSGGRVADLDAAGELAELFDAGPRKKEEVRETGLWDNALVLALLLACLGGEWIIRRTVGLP